MSRSYRKHLWITENSHRNRTLPRSKKSKTIANHVVRQRMKRELADDWDSIPISKGNQYKKMYESWDINDFKFRYEEEHDNYCYALYWKWLNK